MSTATTLQQADFSGFRSLGIGDVEDLSKICCICGKIPNKPVYSLFGSQCQKMQIAEKMHKHLNIEINEDDPPPRGICEYCLNILISWDELVSRCAQIQEILHQWKSNRAVNNETGLGLSYSVQLEQTKPELDVYNNLIPNMDGLSHDPDLLCHIVKKMLTESYFNNLDIEENNSDIQYVCQLCTENSASRSIEVLCSHLILSHEDQIMTKQAVETFIKENIMFEEVLIDEIVDTELEKDSLTTIPNLFCPFCDSVFSSATRLLCHLNKHIEVSIDNGIECCDLYYRDKKSFVAHLQEAHVDRNVVGKEICKSCDFTANDREVLKKHVIENHFINKYECDKKKKDPSPKNQKFIPAVCPECDKVFSNKYNMLVHMKNHNKSSAKFACDKCNRSYKSIGSLSHHQKVVHEGILRFPCPHCAEAFPSKMERDVHTRIHTGYKPFVCTYCGKSFRAKNSLDRHIDMHLDIRMYACSLCPKKFRKRTHLNYHLKTHETKCKYTADSNGSDRYETSENEKNLKYSPKLSLKANSDSIASDDEPLANVATRKTLDSYQIFYTALKNFRDHLVNDHDGQSNCSDFSDSTESGEENIEEINFNGFDDLTESNMRKDKMDEETRIELSEVQTKINGKVFFTCKICGKNLSSSHTYIFHKRIHTGERPCVCHMCGKQFRAPNGLQRHLTETHLKQRRYICIMCHKNFANSQNLKQHMRIHTGERPYVCSHCGKRFTQSGSLHVHLKTHTEQFPHPCADCGSKFRLRSSLKRHRLKHTGERPHVCVHCGKGFRQKHELNGHILTHTDSKPHACTTCGVAFRQRRALRHHCKRLHDNDCADATLVAYNNAPHYDIINDLKMKVKVEAEHEIKQDNEKKKSLLEHKENIERPETVVIEDGKKYGVCNICKKKVLTASWKRHLRSHQATKRFRCHSCGLGFSDSGNLARHTRALHADYRPFACHICHKTFSRKGHLQDHVRSHSDDREYICDMCGKASKSSAALRMHRKVHENGYRFQCLYCNSKFKRQGQLNAHISVHTGEKAHICACGKTFRLKSQLTIHARLHDRVKL